jgi:hypothetical protein
MKYKNLNATVPQGEHFDESAISGEGVWLSTSHVDAIENVLAGNADAYTALQDSLVTAQNLIATHEASISGLETDLNVANDTLANNANRIIELEADIAELNGNASGSGSTVGANAAEGQEDGKTPVYLDDNHPINMAADRHVKRKK